METALQTLLTFQPSARCDRDCIQKLNRSHGFTLEAFRTYLSAGAAFYDGTASRAPIAGTIYPPQAASAWAHQLGLPETFTVADVFNRGGTAQTNALTSITSSSLLVFFRPAAIQRADENAARLFHEGLHGFGGGVGGYDDQTLMTSLGLSGSSHEITRYIERSCF